MTIQEYTELLNFVYENHGWAAKFTSFDDKEKQDKCKFMKYVTAHFDTRDGSIYSVSFRNSNEDYIFGGTNIKDKIYSWLDGREYNYKKDSGYVL